MKFWYDEADGHIIEGDCRFVMNNVLEAESVDSIVTDPPYGLSFMGKGWDHGVPGEDFWREALRVAKPGAHLVAFGGTRTYHRLACAIEDAGWEIRDGLGWLYGSGFPKSLDVSKAIDKAAGAERVAGTQYVAPDGKPRGVDKGIQGGKFASGESAYTPTKLVTAPATDAAREWQGWGTALKPAWEPIILARKPLIGTVAANVQQHGTGALNIDGCRVATTDNLNGGTYSEGGNKSSLPGDTRTTAAAGMFAEGEGRIPGGFVQPEGRWPANICHDGSDEVLAVFPQTGKSSGGKGNASGLIDGGVYGAYSGENKGQNAGGLGDSGSAARFFYCAKASKKDRGEGNTHPTVKPLTLMEWLVTLVTPPGGTVLDPFAGSCTTGVAAQNLGHRFVCIEQDADYAAIGITRLRTVDAA